MDPYLENPLIWRDVHTTLLVNARAQLEPQVRPSYVVLVEENVYVLGQDDPAYRKLTIPDVAVGRVRAPRASALRPLRGGVSTLPMVVEMMPDEIEVKERRLEIRTVPDSAVVTVIEILSPSNKVPGSEGQKAYVTKRDAVLHSGAHLIEIDLLRAGETFPSVTPLPPTAYRIHVSRQSMRPRGEVWAFNVEDPLPVVPVPLDESVPDAALDLQAVLAQVYEQGGYGRRLDYSAPPPPPPLSPADARFAAARLRGPRKGRSRRSRRT
jgi:hypothetical protein